MSQYLTKTLGQIALFTTANFAGFAGLMVYYIPNSVGLDQIKDITKIYRSFEAIPVSENLEKIKNSVMRETNISEDIPVENIELYHSVGFQPISFGSVWKSPTFGGFERAIIGIPLNYNLEDDYFNWNDIVLNKKPINWSTEIGKNLKESLTLSDDAKKFAIAQEIQKTSSIELVFKMALTGLIFPLSIVLCRSINKKGYLLQKSRKLRFSMYSTVFMFSATLWVFLTDALCCHMESKADETIASCGKDYIKGGLEYYEKKLSTNLCLRSLLGSKGEKMYTLYGNEKVLLRQNHLPITYRRDFFKKKLEDAS